MVFEPIPRHRTALRRSDLSRPVRLAFEDGLVTKDTEFFDYGCGYGDDIRHLTRRGITCSGWDPVYQPEVERTSADVVNLGYVINVVEDIAERATALRSAWGLTRKVLIVAARLISEEAELRQTPYSDGWLTRTGTFQKYYEQHQLRDWITETLGVACVAAAPGIFYVFRDSNTEQMFIASRFRRQFATPRQRVSDLLFEQHKALLVPLIDFIATRGRLPDDAEVETASRIRNEIGSLNRAYGIIRRVTGHEQWKLIHEARSQDLLVYLALARFGGRHRFTSLPRDLQLDVRAFFSSYSHACSLADALLFSVGNRKVIDEACRASSVGKLTPEALYVHLTALSILSPVLRIYEGCARGLIGTVEGANVFKLHREKPQISYLQYPDFESDPHPSLSGSLSVNLQTFRVRYFEYAQSSNPPILHRKEQFLSCDHPLYEKFARLTRQEERWGLYEATNRIGTRKGWEEVLQMHGARLSGHRLVRVRKQRM